MCVICELNEQKKPLKDITVLDISGCQFVKKIPYIDGLKTIRCGNCPELKSIAYIPTLIDLDCNFCVKLKRLPNLINLKYLSCYISGLETFPVFKNIFIIDAMMCPNLKYIPNKIKVYNINLSSCDKLENIPYFAGLNLLHADYCNSLKTISGEYNNNYTNIICKYNENLIRVPRICMKKPYAYEGSIWIMKENIQLIKKIQRIRRRTKLACALINYLKSNEFLTWYYHPNGYFVRKYQERINQILLKKRDAAIKQDPN